MNIHDLISIGGAIVGLLSAGAVWGALRQRVVHLEEAEKRRNGRAEGALAQEVKRNSQDIQDLRDWKHDVIEVAAEAVAAAELTKRGLSVPPPAPRRRS